MRWRHLIFLIFLIPFLILYITNSITIVEWMRYRHWLLDIFSYSVLGFLWVGLLIPMINWLARNEN